MSFHFKPAVRTGVSLLIGLAGGTGSGKTYTAMRLASGIAGDKPFAVIDTEAGRARHYADQFRFDVGDLAPPFRPEAYAAAIVAADKADYPVIVVDSMSHVWAGDGGVLDWQEAELDRMAGDNYAKREGCKMAAWIAPKMAHKHMVQALLQVRAHVILCFRAEQKIEMVRNDKGKFEIVPKKSPTGLDGWIPVCEKSLPFELTASFLLTADAPGFPKAIKLQEQHRHLFPPDRAITEESGRGVALWASGGKAGAGQLGSPTNPTSPTNPANPTGPKFATSTTNPDDEGGMPEGRIADALIDVEETDDLAALRAKLGKYQRACRKANNPDAHKRITAAAAARAKKLTTAPQSETAAA